MLDINRILESTIGLHAASIPVKLLDRLIEKMCEYPDCRTLEEQEDEESANKHINHVISSLMMSCSLKDSYFDIPATNSATI